MFYNNRGYYKSKIEKYRDALLDFEKAIALNPKDYFALNNQGYSKFKSLDKSGIEDITLSLKKCPNNSVALKNLALIEIERNNYKKARKLLDKAKRKKFYYQVCKEIAEIEKKMPNNG